MGERLTFTEFVDFVLVRVYERDQEESGVRVNLAELAGELREPVPHGWVVDALRVLDQRGWVRDWGLDNANVAEITGEGRLYVEGRQHQTTLIERYRERPNNYVFISGTGHQVAVGTEGTVTQTRISAETKTQALALVGRMREQLDADDALDPRTREDALSDLATIEAQLERDEPNRGAIRALLDPLSKVAGIGSFAIKLGELVAG